MHLDVERIQRLCPQNELHYFETVGSTMTEAARLAASGAPHQTIVLAEEQTAGIGRLGRSWYSDAELGIYCSILLRLPVEPSTLPVINLLLGLATAEAIQKSTHVSCDLRWPNDVLINERKVAGILAQFLENCVVAGIGINVNQTSFPPDLRTPATSLRIESGDKIQSREDIIINLLQSLDTFSSMLMMEGSECIVRAFTSASSYALDRRVLIEEDGRRGITAGLDEDGFLLVRFDNGRMERIAAGGVRRDA
jgi:BirA family transcriptional regulator, biotin operon repressor / biotin---[acetyl-CoA-carboxylase] ligase